MDRVFYFVFDKTENDRDRVIRRGADKSHSFYTAGATVGKFLLCSLFFAGGFLIGQVIRGVIMGLVQVFF